MPFSPSFKIPSPVCNGIDPSLEEAGIAFGMTKWERLKKFEIPLAMPVIMSGVRTAAVMIIGTATLAALGWSWRTWFLYPSRD